MKRNAIRGRYRHRHTPPRIGIRATRLNHLVVVVEAVHPEIGGRVSVACRLSDGQLLLAEITAYSSKRLGLQAGQQIYALIKSVALME